MNLAPNRLGQPTANAEAILEALFHPTGVDGVYGRSGAYEAVVEGLGALINRARDSRAEVVRFPPVVSRALIEKSGYLKSFPHLLGCVCALGGGDAAIGASLINTAGSALARMRSLLIMIGAERISRRKRPMAKGLSLR